jgi:hypothetical protein
MHTKYESEVKTGRGYLRNVEVNGSIILRMGWKVEYLKPVS